MKKDGIIGKFCVDEIILKKFLVERNDTKQQKMHLLIMMYLHQKRDTLEN